jgi:hypothetical protein
MGFKARERVVTVYYEDIATLQGWHILDAAGRDRTLECAVSGFLVDRDSERIRVAHHACEDDGEYAELTSIPMGCVRRIVYHGTAGRKKVTS